jgi:hypothetical protein
MLSAFCRVAPSARFRDFAILRAGVFCRASIFSSQTEDLGGDIWRCRSTFLMCLELREVPVELGPPVRHPSRRLRAISKDNLLGQIHEGAQARGHMAASWIIEPISGIRGRPLA